MGHEAYDAYRKWVQKAGGQDCTLLSDYVAHVHAGGISKGGAAVRFPASLLITADAAIERDAEFADTLEDFVGDLEEESVVALFLMRQLNLGEASPWHLWLRALPEPLPTAGLCKPGGDQLPVAQEMLEEFTSIFAVEGGLPREFFSRPGESDDVNLKRLWLWANVLIETRSVDTRAWGGTSGCCVVPLAAAPLHAEASPFCWK